MLSDSDSDSQSTPSSLGFFPFSFSSFILLSRYFLSRRISWSCGPVVVQIVIVSAKAKQSKAKQVGLGSTKWMDMIDRYGLGLGLFGIICISF